MGISMPFSERHNLRLHLAALKLIHVNRNPDENDAPSQATV
jgi:hypothetical protein